MTSHSIKCNQLGFGNHHTAAVLNRFAPHFLCLRRCYVDERCARGGIAVHFTIDSFASQVMTCSDLALAHGAIRVLSADGGSAPHAMQ